MPGMVRSRRGRLVVEVVVSPERRPSFPALPMPGLCPRCCVHHPICPLPWSYHIGGVTLPISQSQPLTRRERGGMLRPQRAPWMSPCPGSRLPGSACGDTQAHIRAAGCFRSTDFVVPWSFLCLRGLTWSGQEELRPQALVLLTHKPP